MSDSEQDDLEHCVAITAMSARFPGARNLEEFWSNLRDGVESATFFSDQELLAAGVDRSLLEHPHYVKANGLLDGIDLFDAPFFDCSPREAEILDPQSRIFLECCWEALERALDQLPEPQREVFVLHEMEGKSFKVISEMTGVSVNTLLSRKRYAVLALRDELQELYQEMINI